MNVWSPPEKPRSLTDIRELPVDTPGGGGWRWGGGRRPRGARLRTSSNVSTSRAASTSARISAGATSVRSWATSTGGSREVDFPRGYHAEVLGESAEREAAQRRLRTYGVAAAVAIFLLLQAAFGSWRLATLFFFTLPMALVGGVLAACVGGGTISLGSLVGFLTVLRDRRAQRHPADQPLPAPRALRGRVLRARAGAARRAGAAVADPDDGAGDRAGARPAGGGRRHPRSRDRAPDGVVILGGLVTSTR